jgi:hypothetical protein
LTFRLNHHLDCENLQRRIEHAIAEYEGATGEEVVDISILRGDESVIVMIRPAPR